MSNESISQTTTEYNTAHDWKPTHNPTKASVRWHEEAGVYWYKADMATERQDYEAADMYGELALHCERKAFELYNQENCPHTHTTIDVTGSMRMVGGDLVDDQVTTCRCLDCGAAVEIDHGAPAPENKEW